MEAYDNKLWPVLSEQESCVKSLKQLEDALVDAPSTDEEKEVVVKELKTESSKCIALQASSTEEEDDKEESDDDEGVEEEDELLGSSGMLAKAKAKGHVK